ncbi:MAG: hypothetical protein H2069_03865 [Legionella sp.]|nr:hypothetical protein [Legionella sp.]
MKPSDEQNRAAQQRKEQLQQESNNINASQRETETIHQAELQRLAAEKAQVEQNARKMRNTQEMLNTIKNQPPSANLANNNSNEPQENQQRDTQDSYTVTAPISSQPQLQVTKEQMKKIDALFQNYLSEFKKSSSYKALPPESKQLYENNPRTIEINGQKVKAYVFRSKEDADKFVANLKAQGLPNPFVEPTAEIAKQIKAALDRQVKEELKEQKNTQSSNNPGGSRAAQTTNNSQSPQTGAQGTQDTDNPTIQRPGM